MKRLIVGVVVVIASVFVVSLSTSSVLAQAPDYCEGDFDNDGDQDGSDAGLFKSDFGRSMFQNPCPAKPQAQVPKTGQTFSHGTGDDGDLEKGVECPTPRFTDNLDGTVTDNLTGLIWLKDANCSGQTTWEIALSNANALASGPCGLSDGSNAGDWRLPNRFELESLLVLNRVHPALPLGHPFTDVQSSPYWSSTTLENASIHSWFVDMAGGWVGYDAKFSYWYFWPVRDPL